ncbi:hypothetical protein E0H54_29240 [Rhizobium leguminosarum bv. viciae]|nr:hypothetical protein E0H54_29240 [Rhizobium leguminosarum bv. viciae]
MTKYEIEEHDGGWRLVDHMTRLPASGAATRRTRLEAQALADFRNGIAKPTAERTRPRLEKIRLLWKVVLSASR